MKRITLLLILAAFSMAAFSQQLVTVSGTVTDNMNGQPLANQAVQIWSDSTGGLVYNSVVYTNSSGQYIDTIPLTGGDTSGYLWIQTLDCQNLPVQYYRYYGPGMMSLIQDFQICVNAPCSAEFSWYSGGTVTVQFVNQSVGSSGPWFWNFGDGTTSTIFSPQHTYATGGTYSVSLTIGDSTSSCWDMITHLVVVADTTIGGCVAGFLALPDSSSQNTMLFIDQSTGNINSWFWEFGDGQTATLQNPVHTYATAGLYTVCLTVQGADSLCYDEYCEIINVTVPSGCQAQFTWYPDSTTLLNQVQFIDLSTGNPFSWFWDFGDSTFSTEQHPVHLFQQPGNYYVCLTIEAGNAGAVCQSTWCNEIVVGSPIDCPNYFTFQKNALTVSFTGHMVTGQAVSYAWNFGDGYSGQGQSAIHQYPASGIYYVSLTTVTADSSCTYTSSQSITVGDSTQWNQVYGQVFAGNFPLESGLVMIFSLDTTSSTYVPFIDVSLIDSSGIYYFPMVPQGEFLIYAIPFVPTGYLPTYYGDVIDWLNATVVTLGTASNPYNINLVEAMNFNTGEGNITGQINTGLKSDVLNKMTMILFNEQGAGIWFDQVDLTGGFDFADLSWGTYSLKVELAGCSSDLVEVTLSADQPVAEVTMTFSGTEILGIPSAGTVLEGGAVYPNPVRDQASITITLESSGQVVAEVINLTGQTVLSESNVLGAGSHTLTLTLDHLRNGMYTLLISTENGPSIARKLMISR